MSSRGFKMAGTRALDRRSRDIVRSELLVNLLLEAGAGSGKTQMLAERMAAGVARGVYAIEHMAAVTFTRKAAAELRGRFHLALEDALHEARTADPSGTSPEIQRLAGALSNLERFFAGTIHAFCARLLRERPIEAGVSPGFTELDELQDAELRRRTWREFVDGARSAGDPDMLALLDADVRPRDLDEAFAFVYLNEDVDFPPSNAEPPDPGPARRSLEAFWAELQRHLPAVLAADTTCPVQKAAREFKGRYQVSRDRLDRPAAVASLLEIWNCESTIVQKRWAEAPDERARLRDLISPLHEQFRTGTVVPYLSQWRHYVYRLAIGLLMRARQHARDERLRADTLNYGDLLLLTARVLRDNGDVRRALQQKYRHLFVDEFQDTDPIQAEILFLLAADERAPRHLSGSPEPPADWRAVSLRPGALFVVGDPKQSIYRFRRADIDTYNIVRTRLEDPAVGRVLPLTRNFRSVPVLCEWANEVFRQRFPDHPTPHSPTFAALDPDDERDRPGGLFTITHTGEKADVHADDARRIAEYVRAEVDAGRRQYGDFLILTRRKRERLIPYVKALEALNIPVEVSGAGAFGDSAEVRALAHLLRVLADPQDAVALVGLLRGPLFGVSDRELFAFRRSGGWFTIFSAPSDGETEPIDPVRAALAALERYHRWTRLLPAGAALERMLEDTGYLALAATTPGGVEAGDLLHAVDRVRQVVERGGSLADAADALEQDGGDDNEVESLPLEPGRGDVVRVMNLHKAKGLEAAVVFLADPLGGFGPRVDRRIVRTDAGAQGWLRIFRTFESGGARPVAEPADWAEHEALELPYLEAELDRLLYVAATRAREQLVISRWTGKHAPAWGVLASALGEAQELPLPAPVAVPAAEPMDCSATADSQAAAARRAAHARALAASWSVTSATAEARRLERVAGAAGGPAAADDPTTAAAGGTSAHRADAGMAWGTLVHGLLEHAMRHDGVAREDLRRLGMRLTCEEPQLRAVLEEAVDTVLQVAASDWWRAAKAGEHLEETPFTVRQRGGALSAGVIDLLFRREGGWRIRDYKTDRSLDAGAYERQLRAYRDALAAVGCTVDDAALVHVRHDDDGMPRT